MTLSEMNCVLQLVGVDQEGANGSLLQMMKAKILNTIVMASNYKHTYVFWKIL